MLNIFVIVLVGFFIIEYTCKSLFFYIRKNFQWLIIDKLDQMPDINKESLGRFLGNGYDPELGWVRKPNTKGSEKNVSAGVETSAALKSTAYTINEKGSRLNPGHEAYPVRISTYGDSFVFSRHVEDNQTWQWHLSELTGTNVTNWGVGNYGFDQGLLRLQREYDNNVSKIVIMGVVPETIVRILSVWKHYTEYGNLLGFKPRYIIENGRLSLVKNIIDDSSKFFQLKKYAADIQRYDFFYENKFKKDLLSFPYSLTMFKNPSRTFGLLWALILREASLRGLGRQKWFALPWRLVLKRNFQICKMLYKNKEAVDLFLKLIEEFSRIAQEKRFKPVLLIFPYLHDVYYNRQKGKSYYCNLLEQARHKLNVIDLTDYLAGCNALEELYINDFYGGHLSSHGNELIAEIINKELKC